MRYAADFETTTIIPASVWAWALCPVGLPDKMRHGENIESFFQCCMKLQSPTVYFHNARFDGSFIFYYLLKNGFTVIEDREQKAPNTFRALISRGGDFLSLEIYFPKNGKLHKVTIWDSMKLFRMSLAELAQCFNIGVGKGKIDYSRHDEPCEITTEEWEYIDIDVYILQAGLKKALDAGLDRMTIGSCALHDYKKMIGEKRFKFVFPTINLEDDVQMRKAFKGAFVYLNPEFKAKEIGKGLLLDTNGLYSYILATKPLPYGLPVKFEGEYQPNEDYPLWIQNFRCFFKLKPGKLPTIQQKYDVNFMKTEYLVSSVSALTGEDEYVELSMTCIDMIQFFEHYDVYCIEWCGGYMFKSSSKLFTDWIAKWDIIKEEADKSGNKALRFLAKLIVNNLYGKFAQNPIVENRIPVLNEIKDIVQFDFPVDPETGEVLQKVIDPVYIPVGIFITAWGRNHTIKAAQMLHEKGRFIYSDTDSLHILFQDLPKIIDIDPVKLGFWKIEAKFDRAKYLCAKRYILLTYCGRIAAKPQRRKLDAPKVSHIKGLRYKRIELKIVCAGMPARCKSSVTFENFKTGMKYDGKFEQVYVPGGMILRPVKFTLSDPGRYKDSKHKVKTHIN